MQKITLTRKELYDLVWSNSLLALSKKYNISKIQLLILDDFGLHPMDNNVKLALLQMLEDRYGKRSVIITSQLPVNSWYEYLSEPTLADAIMDRLSANAHRIEGYS
jgi:DNA replication protein DnaC